MSSNPILAEASKMAFAFPNGMLFGIAYGTAIRIGYEQIYPALFPKKTELPPQTTDVIIRLQDFYTQFGGLEAHKQGMEQGVRNAMQSISMGTGVSMPDLLNPSIGTNPDVVSIIEKVSAMLGRPLDNFPKTTPIVPVPPPYDIDPSTGSYINTGFDKLTFEELERYYKEIQAGTWIFQNDSVKVKALKDEYIKRLNEIKNNPKYPNPTIITPTTPPPTVVSPSPDMIEYNAWNKKLVSILEKILAYKKLLSQISSVKHKMPLLQENQKQQIKENQSHLDNARDELKSYLQISRNSKNTQIHAAVIRSIEEYKSL